MFILGGSVEPLFGLALLVLGVAVVLLLKRRCSRTDQEVIPEDASLRLAGALLIKPYLQLGDHPQLSALESVEILWFSTLQPHSWSVQARVQGEVSWRQPVVPVTTEFIVPTVLSGFRHRATLADLPPGADFEYRVLCDGAIAQSATGRTRNAVDQRFTFAVAGDLGTSFAPHEQAIARRMHAFKPDMVMVPGDIVYDKGLVSEYLRDLFVAYNSDKAATGAPLMRSRMLFGTLGNHDVALPHVEDHRDFSVYPDLLGYFLFLAQPLNGPLSAPGAANTPNLEGDMERQFRFLSNAGSAFPRMSNFSLDWGCAHWTVLDSNAYMDWSQSELLSWLEADLAAAQQATWRFVCFHHPTFSSDGKHGSENRMRALCPLFEKYHVDVVFTGHNHCYERTYPLRFQPHPWKVVLNSEDCPVTGDLEIDTTYDGTGKSAPKGVIYLVDGAGGAKYYPEYQPKDGLKPFTCCYDQSVHSFTLCEVNGKTFVARQISAAGDEIDRFTIVK